MFQNLHVAPDVILCTVANAEREIRTLGEIILPVIYGNHTLEQNFVISDEIKDACILGWDAIKRHGFILNGANQTIFLGGVNSVQSSSPPRSLLALPNRSAVICTASVKGPTITGSFFHPIR